MGSQAVAERDVTIRIPKDYAAFLVSEARSMQAIAGCSIRSALHFRYVTGSADGDGDLELSAPPGVLSYLASECILADAENIPSAWGDAFLQDRRAGDVRRAARARSPERGRIEKDRSKAAARRGASRRAA